MSKIKSLILGSAAALVAIGGAQAADLPVKAKAVEYVKVCSLYGAGFFYIPGTDTCIKLGGYVRADYNFNAANTDAAFLNGAGGQHSLFNNANQTRSRIMMQVDTRTATEYGVVRTFASFGPQWSTGDGLAAGGMRVEAAFIQFAGFTFGRSASAYALPWNATPGGQLNSILIGGPNYDAGVNNIQYTWQFGNGVSASLGLDEQGPSNRTGVYNSNEAMTYLGVYTDRYQGTTTAPDVVGNIRLDQAWGLIQLSAAAHQVTGGYADGALEGTGHPSDKWGFAVTGGLQIKNLPTGPGDDIKLSATYTQGALRYALGNSGATPTSYSLYGGGGNGVYNNIATAPIADAVYGAGSAAAGAAGNAGTLELTKAWGVNGAFNHNWNQNWSSSVFGGYAQVNYGAVASNLICLRTGYAANAAVSCNPDFNIAQVGFVTRWTPVKNLTFSGEVSWTNIDSGITSPAAALAANGVKPATTYSLGSQDVWSGALRVQRNF